MSVLGESNKGKPRMYISAPFGKTALTITCLSSNTPCEVTDKDNVAMAFHLLYIPFICYFLHGVSEIRASYKISAVPLWHDTKQFK